MTDRHLVWASVTAGLLAGAGFVVGFFDPAYYKPVTAFDYFGSVLNDLGLVGAGVALIIWWRITPVRSSAPLVLGAGIGLALWAVGNVLEELIGVPLGETIYFVGGVGAFGLSAAAGAVTLFAQSRWRWSGLILLSISVSIGFEVIPTAPVAWLVFAYLLSSGWFDTPSDASDGSI
jgi:hypothetical protein